MAVGTSIELYRTWAEITGGDWEPLSPFDRDAYLKKWQTREDCRRRFAYAIPTEEALALLLPHAPFVEIGAGTGYWASLLAERGARVLAYDANVAGEHDEWTYCDVDHPFFPVGKGGPERAAAHPDHTLVLIWPPYAEPMACDALRAYTGQTVVYVGEGEGGCTGDDAFHQALNAEWEHVAECAIPQWWGLHDWLWVYRRKDPRLP